MPSTRKYINSILLIIMLHCWSGSCCQDAKLMFAFGHTGKVMYAVFSPDGKRIVTASMDKTAKIWDAATGKVLTDLKGNKNFVYTEEFSPDGSRILTSSFDSTAKVWDANSGELLLNLKGHKDEVWAAHYSKDGKKIVTCSRDNTAKLWDATTGKWLMDLTGHTSFILAVSFSPDGKKIASASYDNTIRVWDSETGKALHVLNDHTGKVYAVQFSADGNMIISASADSTAKIWQTSSGKLLFDLKGHQHKLWIAEFSSDNKYIATASFDGGVKVWDAGNGKLLHDLPGHRGAVWHLKFSPDNKKIVTASDDRTFKVWDIITGKILVDVPAHSAQVRTASFSPDGNRIVTSSDDKTAKIWDATSGKMLMNLKGNASGLWSVNVSPDGQNILMASGDNTAKIWDIKEGRIIRELKGHTDTIHAALYSPANADDPAGGKNIVTISSDKTAKIWDAKNGNVLSELKHAKRVTAVDYSRDGKLVATGSDDNTVKIWDARNGILLQDCKAHTDGIWSVVFSHDTKKLASASRDGSVKIWDINTGKVLTSLNISVHQVPGLVKRATAGFNTEDSKIVTTGIDSVAVVWDISGKKILELSGHTDGVLSAKFSTDGKKIITASFDKTAKIWDAASGALLKDLKGGHSFHVRSAEFNSDGSKAITISRDNSIKIWDTNTGNVINDMVSSGASAFWTGEAEYGSFNNDGTYFITASGKTAVSVWDPKSGNLVYTFFAVNGTDFLVLDKEGRFDGTDAARKMLYFTCGTEVISFDQLKDRLWVPNLASRLMQKDVINNTKLSDIKICAYAPQVDKINKGIGYNFKITPREGGLGETVLYVNNIEVRRYTASGLVKSGQDYLLTVQPDEVQKYFVPGNDNTVMVKAYVTGNDISSRGIEVGAKTVSQNSVPPNLHAVIIGVSDYKGDGLDLKYAGKDARDISNAVALSAGKLLGKEHVFVYTLTTDKERYRLPEKQSIKDLFAEIGKKASPNDILLIFFAGHGVLEGSNKQFYFLTADASTSSISPSGLRSAGISTEELMEWMKPVNIKAQKRILILDACNSGSAINQIVDIGKGQYAAARNDDKSIEIKQIDKLNERSGMYILSASASNQSAYELGKYSQGLLTYALLKVIKEHPELLEDNKFLNVSNWFNQTVKLVSDIVRENNLRQEPQLITTTNFNIGVVDNEVLAKIILPNEKPVFASSNFQNSDEAIADDDLELSKYINQQLNEIATRGTEGAINYVTSSNAPDAWSLTGRYTVKDDEVSVRINIKQNKTVKNSMEIKGKKSALKELAAEIVIKATGWILNPRLP